MNNNIPSTKVVTRFAPSPTGYLHLGNYRTAVFCYLFARQHNGSFIVRIEDTDRERSKQEYAEDIVNSLAWMNLTYDALYRQGERADIHKQYLEKLIAEDKAFLSKEESKMRPGETVEVVRLRNPGQEITFKDSIRGDITVDTTDLGDFVIARSLAEPLYHLAVVVDDFEMGVTHIIRGEDHISNTPRHILIQDAIGAPRPHYAHLPLVLAPDRSKLSKRKGALSIKDCKEAGYLPEAVVNALALVGWNPGTEQELFTLEELVSVFSLEKIHPAGAIFNIDKLKWFNRAYIAKLPQETLLAEIENRLTDAIKNLPQFSRERLLRVVPHLKERIDTFADITALSDAGELAYYFVRPEIEVEKLSFKGETPLPHIREHLMTVIEALENIHEETFGTETVKAAIWDYASEVGRGAVLWPMRYALSGKDKSPDPFTLSDVLGKEETLSRLRAAYDRIL